MRIEEGKYYRAVKGQEVGPMSREPKGWFFVEHERGCWLIDGEPEDEYTFCEFGRLTDTGPVRTVTRQEIIPGTYDGVVVSAPEHPDLESTTVLVSIRHLHLDADQLDRAAAVLTALAGALRDE